MNVLYIEDHSEAVDRVVDTLEGNVPQIQVDHVATLADALDHLNLYESAHGRRSTAVPWPEGWEKPPCYDLVLADLTVRDGSGLEMLAHVRRRDLPLAVVILSSSGNEEAVLASIRAGADDYVTRRENFLNKLPAILTDALTRFREEASRRSRPLRVLYAEPNLRDVETTIRELARLSPHLHIEIAVDATDVLQRIGTGLPGTAPDILLLDYRLPGTSGTDLLRELCLVRKLDLPIILMTGQSDEDVALLAVRLGASDYVLKAGGYLQKLPSIIENAWLRAESRRQAKALADEKAKMAAIIDSAMDAIITVTESQEILLFNLAAEKVFGCSTSHAIGKKLDQFIPKRYRQQHHRFFQEFSDNGFARNLGLLKALTGLRATGEEFPMETSISRVVINGQKLFTVILRDITRRAQAEMALQASADFIKDVIDSQSSNIVVLDSEGKIISVNDAWKEFASYTHPEDQPPFMIGTEYFTVCIPYLHRETPELAEQVLGGIRGVIAGRETSYAVEYDLATPLEDRTYSMRVSPLTGISQGAVIVHTNVTEKRRLERQLRQSQKMEAIGQLSSGVAHDFNNILTVVQMHSAVLEKDKNLSTTQRESVLEIGKAIDRATHLTRQLLAFGRRQTMQPSNLNINEVVAGMTSMLGRIVGEDIQVQLHYSPQPLVSHADSGMIEQILLNLVVNARDAMPKGGRLVIKTSSVQLDAVSAVKIQHARPGSFVCVSVRDTGMGIPTDLIHRIFDPFFTTKEIGKGTGLGLPTVYGILQQHNGWINVDSVPGHGATFTFYLPRVCRQAESKEPTLPAPLALGGKETILVAEDEPNLRLVVRLTLGELGYRILEASTGREALRIWKERESDIHLLFTDLVMPDGMNGRELGEQILNDDPAMKVLYTSGYSSEVAGKELKLHEGVNFLGKPFHPAKLAQIIRQKLDGAEKPVKTSI